MDFKKLSVYIIGFGVALFAIGAIWFLSNLPVDASQYQDPNATGWAAVTKSFGAGIEAHDENMKRADARGSATWTMIFGVIIGLGGVAVRRSSKTETSPQSTEQSADVASASEPIVTAASANQATNIAATEQTRTPVTPAAPALPADAILCPRCSKMLVRGSGQTHCHHCQEELPRDIRAALK